MRSYLISGAGSGIGRALAVKLSKDPEHRVILLGRSEDKFKSTRQRMSQPERHSLAVADVTDARAVRQQLHELRPENLHAVIANAGVSLENHYGENDSWREVIDTNLHGTYILANESLPYLKKSGERYRHVLIVSSILAHMGVPGHSAYCASKAGQLGMMRSWAVEWAADRILVNAICPGWVDTDMAERSIQRIAAHTGRKYQDEFAEQMNLVPLKKPASPEEIADLACFLISPAQTSITGEEIQINNGAYMV